MTFADLTSAGRGRPDSSRMATVNSPSGHERTFADTEPTLTHGSLRTGRFPSGSLALAIRATCVIRSARSKAESAAIRRMFGPEATKTTWTISLRRAGKPRATGAGRGDIQRNSNAETATGHGCIQRRSPEGIVAALGCIPKQGRAAIPTAEESLTLTISSRRGVLWRLAKLSAAWPGVSESAWLKCVGS